VKHIWQSSQKHTPGTFNVTEHVAGLTLVAYLRAIFTFPINDRAKKYVSVCWSPNLRNLEKDLPEPAGVGSFRRSTAPRQTLPLDVYQTPLHYDIGPEPSKNSYHLWVAIYGKTARGQTGGYQRLKEPPQLRFGTLGDTVLPSHDHMSLGIHQGNKTVRTTQKCSVHNEVTALFQIRSGRWYLLQLVIDHSVKFPLAIAALISQLPGRITFNNPASKPIQLFRTTGSSAPVTLATRAPTRPTEPALSSLGIMTIPLEEIRANRAEFFYA
jgi:hypothetical protein